MSSRIRDGYTPMDASADKVMPLSQAIDSAVRPGATLHFAFSHNRPAAAMAALLRRFRGTDPAFTLLHLFTAGPAIALLSEGLVERLVTSLVCEPYPAPAPSRAAQRAVADGRAEIEHTSVLSYIARLEAAARGLPSLPVRGLVGTSLADSPGVSIRPDGLAEVAALTPDVSFVHAPCADRFGNTLLSPPLAEDRWGAFAARDGVVVTAERLVDPEVIRRHAHLPSIPASRVRSVSVVPFGAHPAGLAAGGVEGVESYGDDVAFYTAARRAGVNEEGWRQWTERWLLEPGDQQGYLARVGPQRLLWLKGKARPDSWRPELAAARHRLRRDLSTTAAERMVVAAAHVIAGKVRRGGYGTVLSGIGAANLAAWLAHSQEQPARTSSGSSAALAPFSLAAEIGLYGYTPRPCDPYLFNFRNLATCTLASGSQEVLGVLVGGAGAGGLGSLGAGQVDARGAFNSTQLGDGTLLVGSGGANDVAASAEELVITLPTGRQRLVQELPYITGGGERVTAVVTELGVFEKPVGDELLRLTRLVGPLHDGDGHAHVAAIRARTGFSFEVATDLSVAEPPGASELERLRLYDPEGLFLGRSALSSGQEEADG